MELKLKRIAKKEAYTIGHLYIDGIRFCDTIEDKDRGLNMLMPTAKIKAIKVPNETAIPTGRYKVLIGVVSPRLSKIDYYKKLCNGIVPRLQNVPGFDGILIHCGNTAKDSAGCILVGKNKEVGKVLESKATFEALWKRLKDANLKGESIYITIE